MIGYERWAGAIGSACASVSASGGWSGQYVDGKPRAHCREAENRPESLTAWAGHASAWHAASSLVDQPWPPISCPGWTMMALGRGDPQGTGRAGGDSDRPGRGGDWFPLPMVRRSRWQRWDGGCSPRSTARLRKQTCLNPHHTAVGFTHRGILSLSKGQRGCLPAADALRAERMQYAGTRARPAVGRIVAACGWERRALGRAGWRGCAAGQGAAKRRGRDRRQPHR